MSNTFFTIVIVLVKACTPITALPVGPHISSENSINPINSNELRIINRCQIPVWPGIVSDAGSEILANGGFYLEPTLTEVFPVSSNWSGKVWGRTGCVLSQDKCTFWCDTGDCGVGLCCGNYTGKPPMTLAKISFGVSRPNDGEVVDSYSVNVIDGYNLQLQVRPVLNRVSKKTHKRSDCNLSGCFKDLKTVCPEDFAQRSKGRGYISGCLNPCPKSNRGEYEKCSQSQNGTEFLSLVQEHCPEVIAFDSEFCTGGNEQQCRKGTDGFSAYEVIFCP